LGFAEPPGEGVVDGFEVFAVGGRFCLAAGGNELADQVFILLEFFSVLEAAFRDDEFAPLLPFSEASDQPGEDGRGVLFAGVL